MIKWEEFGDRVSREHTRTPLNGVEGERLTLPSARRPWPENDQTPFTSRSSQLRSVIAQQLRLGDGQDQPLARL